MPRQQDLVAGIRMGEIGVSLVASGVSYSPDIADDLVRRTVDMWNGALSGLDEMDMLDNSDGEYEEETPEDYLARPKELQDPRVVRFLEGLGEEHE